MPLRRSRTVVPPLAWLACSAALAAGCAQHAPNGTPEATVAAYAQALARGDAAAVAALTSPSAPGGNDLAAIAEALAHHDAEAEEIAQALSAPVAVANQTAWVALQDGTEVQLERRGDGWAVVSPAPTFYSQGTPREAIRSFARALRHQRWGVLLELMPDAARGELTAEQLGENLRAQRQEWERMLSLLEISLQQPIEVVGDRATMPYGEGFAAHLVREEGRWKVEDPE